MERFYYWYISFGIIYLQEEGKGSIVLWSILLISYHKTLLVEKDFQPYFPNFNWETAYKIQTLTFYLGVPIILMYFKFIFKKDVPSAFVRIVQTISAAFAIIVVLTPVRTYSILNPLFQIFCFISIAILLFIFIRLVFRRNRTSIAIILEDWH